MPPIPCQCSHWNYQKFHCWELRWVFLILVLLYFVSTCDSDEKVFFLQSLNLSPFKSSSFLSFWCSSTFSFKPWCSPEFSLQASSLLLPVQTLFWLFHLFLWVKLKLYMLITFHSPLLSPDLYVWLLQSYLLKIFYLGALFFQSSWDIIDKWECMYLRYTIWCFDRCINCEMISTLKLNNLSIISCPYHLF